MALQEQEQQQQQQIADSSGGGGKGGRSSSKGGGRVRRVLPYAVALAAVLSVDSPFVHIDAVPSGGGDGGAAAGEDETAAEAVARREKEAQRQEEKDANKKKRNAAREAHAQYRVADSDALRCGRSMHNTALRLLANGLLLLPTCLLAKHAWKPC